MELDQTFDIDALIAAARALARTLHRPPPADEAVVAIVDDVIVSRGTLECVKIGAITSAEAVRLLLSHLKSTLFEDIPEPDPWNHEELIHLVKRGLFGAARAP